MLLSNVENHYIYLDNTIIRKGCNYATELYV